MTNQKDMPMLMTAPMVRAVLENRKTQTRRLKFRKGWEGFAGRRIWCKETFCIQDGCCVYRANEPNQGCADVEDMQPWKPSIFMPRCHSRITLEITKTRKERLQDISDADVEAEGLIIDKSTHFRQPPLDAYRCLWESINGKGSFERNPEVLVYEFRRVA